MTPLQTVKVLNLDIAVVTKSSAAAQAESWAMKGDRAYAIEAADVHVVTRARHETAFGQCMDKFDMICPDGMPILWSANRQLEKVDRMPDRVCGADLMQEVMSQTTKKRSGSHFLLGGKESTLATLEETLPIKVAGVEIAGSYSPPFGEWPSDEFERICSKIIASGASHIWVGLGCPKQERWISEYKAKLPAGCYYGVGAAFAFHAGEIPRAPRVFQKTGTEWLYRLVREPRRLWRRYFTYNSLFIKYTFLD
ncbi:MAG: WecB/TagA/CpsF family glycosyltransferase [Akkermansiaceae bacterium]